MREEGTERVRGLLGEERAVVSRLTEVEVVSALSRRHRAGDLSSISLSKLLVAFEEELAALTVVELTEGVARRSRELLLTHSLRAADSVQLASCLELRERLGRPVRFLAFDERLVEAAVREGLPLA